MVKRGSSGAGRRLGQSESLASLPGSPFLPPFAVEAMPGAGEDRGEQRARERIQPVEHLSPVECNNRFRIFNKNAQQISLL